MSVIQVGSLSDFELPIQVFVVLIRRHESDGTATRSRMIL